MRESNQATSWVVYEVPATAKRIAMMVVCEQGEWERLAQDKTELNLIRSGITNEGEAEQLATTGRRASKTHPSGIASRLPLEQIRRNSLHAAIHSKLEIIEKHDVARSPVVEVKLVIAGERREVGRFEHTSAHALKTVWNIERLDRDDRRVDEKFTLTRDCHGVMHVGPFLHWGIPT